MSKLLSKIFQNNTIQVIGIFKDSNEDRYDLLTVKKSKNKLDILVNKSFSNFELLQEKINLKIPTIINIDGKGVLNKKIDLKNESDVTWQKNLDLKSIYYTSYSNDEVIHMSFCRNNFIEEYTNVFNKKGIQIIDVYIGSFLSVLLEDSLNENKIISGNLNLDIENKKIISFSKLEINAEKKYAIGDDSYTNYSIPLFSIAINYFVDNESISKTQWINNNVEELVYRKTFNTFGIIILIGFFITLFISYFLIQFYSSKNAELNVQNVYSNKSYQQIVALEKQKQEKEKIIKESGFLSEKFLTYYSYQILNSIPNSISLSELNISPLTKEIKSNEKVEVISGTIIVSGQTINEEEFNRWLKELKTFDWIIKFEIERLNKDKKSNTKFELKITIK